MDTFEGALKKYEDLLYANARVRRRVARSPVFYGRSRISAPVSRLPEGNRPGDRISRI